MRRHRPRGALRTSHRLLRPVIASYRLLQRVAGGVRADLTMPSRSRTLLADLGVPASPDLDHVLEAVEKQRGREIRTKITDARWIQLVTGDSTATACWMPGKEFDWILVDSSLGLIQRVLACLHELGHMQLGHQNGLLEHLEVVTPKMAQHLLKPSPGAGLREQELPDLLGGACSAATSSAADPLSGAAWEEAVQLMRQRPEGAAPLAMARSQWGAVPEREAELYATWVCRRLLIEGRGVRPRSSAPELEARARLMLGLPELESDEGSGKD